MCLEHPLAVASAIAAMTGAPLITSLVLVDGSNSNSSSTPSGIAEATTPPGKPAQPSPAPGKTGGATPTLGKTAAGNSFRITQKKTFAFSSTNTSFIISGIDYIGKQATVGIALYAPNGPVSDVVKTEAVAGGSWISDLDLAAFIKSIGITTATTTDGRAIGAGCMIYGDETEITQVTRQQQTQIYFDDTCISDSYEVSAHTESQSQTSTFHAQGFYASEEITALLRSKSDSSISYTPGELTIDANDNPTGSLSALTDAPGGEYVLVLADSRHSETATSQTVTTVFQHTPTIASSKCSTTETETSEQKAVENNGGGDKAFRQETTNDGDDKTSEQGATESNGGGDKTAEQKITENNGGSDKSTEQRATENDGGGDKTSEQKTTENNGSDDRTSEQKTTERSTPERQNSEQNVTRRSTSECQNIEQKTSRQNTTEHSTSGNNGGGNKQAGGDKTIEQKASEKRTTEDNDGGNNGGSNSNANAGGDKQAKADENKAGTGKSNDLNSDAKDSSSESRASGETTKDSGSSLARTGTNGLLFGGIAVFLAVAEGATLALRRRSEARVASDLIR